MFSLNGLGPVIPLGAVIMAAGYARMIYKVKTEFDEDRVPDTFLLRSRVDVAMLCNIVSYGPNTVTIRSGDLRDESCEACQLRLKIYFLAARLSSPLHQRTLLPTVTLASALLRYHD
jgi:hypothetical protein